MATHLRKRRIVWAGIGLGLAAGLTLTARPASADGQLGGLYEDANGRGWCGGTCGASQSCCKITIVTNT
jgi:hypothetical protein